MFPAIIIPRYTSTRTFEYISKPNSSTDQENYSVLVFLIYFGVKRLG